MQMTKMNKVSTCSEIISYCFSQKARSALKKAKSFEYALRRNIDKTKNIRQSYIFEGKLEEKIRKPLFSHSLKRKKCLLENGF